MVEEIVVPSSLAFPAAFPSPPVSLSVNPTSNLENRLVRLLMNPAREVEVRLMLLMLTAQSSMLSLFSLYVFCRTVKLSRCPNVQAEASLLPTFLI